MTEAGDGASAPPVTNVSQKLRARQHVARLLRDLLATDDPRVMESCAAGLLAAGHDLLVMIARSLAEADPRAIIRLGSLAAAYPDRAAALAFLRQEALDPRNADRKRMAVMVVLEQFLDQPLGDEYFATLRDPSGVAVNSLVQVLEGAQRDRNLLLAYLSAFEEQHPAALGTVLDNLENLSSAQGLEILKLVAQHPDEDLAERALTLLLAGRRAPGLRALRMLELVAPPARRARIARPLRKLSMAGLALPPFAVPPPGARALLTGIDGAGGAGLWFLVPRPDGQIELLSLLLSDSGGIMDAFGGDDFSAGSFPPPAPVGTVHRGLEPHRVPGAAPAALPVPAALEAPAGDFAPLVPWPGEPWPDDLLEPGGASAAPPAEADFLEIPFEYGRRLVAEYQALTWAGGAPLPWEYRLFHDIIWRFGPPPDRSPLPVPRPTTGDSALLLARPYFQSWDLPSETLLPLVEVLRADPAAASGFLLPDSLSPRLRAALITVVRAYFTTEQRARYAGRLRATATWLQCAGDPQAAGLAAQAAADLEARALTRHRFALALAVRSALRAVQGPEIAGPPAAGPQ
jgi:hypothetical protein